MWYLDKKWILEHLGKDKKDTRWVDRAISKGVVWRDPDTWAYTLCTEYINELEEENVKLKIKAWEIEWYHCMKDWNPDLWVREKRYYELKTLYDNLVKENEVDKNDNQEKKDDKISSSSTSSEKSDLEFAIEEYDRISSVLVSSMKKCYNIFIQMKKIDPNQESFEVFYKWITWESLNH